MIAFNDANYTEMLGDKMHLKPAQLLFCHLEDGSAVMVYWENGIIYEAPNG